jgi:hypothetical protein
MGDGSKAAIRVFTVLDGDRVAVGYRVQIPSTASFSPIGSSGNPGDLTSDVYAMWQGDHTALSAAVLEAMRQEGIPTGPRALPVQLDGFSLGGITAAAIAADPNGFNITEIHTAGAPIGRMEIPAHTRVVALEATQDPVPALDGARNQPRWTTIRGSGAALATDSPTTVLTPFNVHDPDRYGAMGLGDPRITPRTNDTQGAMIGRLDIPSGGHVRINDYYAMRM